jgi:hypothetical protein
MPGKPNVNISNTLLTTLIISKCQRTTVLIFYVLNTLTIKSGISSIAVCKASKISYLLHFIEKNIG